MHLHTKTTLLFLCGIGALMLHSACQERRDPADLDAKNLFQSFYRKFMASGAPPRAKSLDTGEAVPDWMVRWELAKALSYAKRYDESLLEYDKLLDEKPDVHEARLEKANILFWQGKDAEALRIFEQSLAHITDDKTKILVAELYLSRKKYREAAPLYREHLAKHADDQAVRLRLAEMLSWMKKYDEALALFEIILKSRPDDVQARRKYAQTLHWAGRHEEAAKQMKRTLPQ